MLESISGAYTVVVSLFYLLLPYLDLKLNERRKNWFGTQIKGRAAQRYSEGTASRREIDVLWLRATCTLYGPANSIRFTESGVM